MNNSTINGDASPGTLSFEEYKTVKFIFFQILIPAIAVIGSVGNFTSFLVLAENKAKYAFATYLKALTLADTAFLLGALIWFILSIYGKYIATDKFDEIEIYGHLWFRRRIGSWLQALNSGFVTVISFERFIAVVFPLKVKQSVVDRHPFRVVIAIMIFHAIVMLPAMLFVEVKSTASETTNATSYYLGYTDFGRKIVGYYFILVTLVKYIIPLIIVVSTTTAVIICLRLREVSENTQGKKWCIERDRMSVVLIVIAIFFTCNALHSVALTVIVIFYPKVVQSDPLAYQINSDLLLVVLCLNCASDFVIYILSSKKFRHLFIVKLLCCQRQEPSIKRSLSQGVIKDNNSTEMETATSAFDEFT